MGIVAAPSHPQQLDLFFLDFLPLSYYSVVYLAVSHSDTWESIVWSVYKGAFCVCHILLFPSLQALLPSFTMGEKSLPKTPSLSKKTSSMSSTGGKQKSILGFFSKPSQTPTSGPAPSAKSSPKDATNSSPCLKESATKSNFLPVKRKPAANITPVPSSDALEPSSSQENHSEATPQVFNDLSKMALASSPSRRVSQPRTVHICMAIRPRLHPLDAPN